MDPASRTEDLQQELAALRKELAMARRSADQWRRVAETSESMSTHSKRVMLRTLQDLERTIEELRVAKTVAEEASFAKGRFVATISHELRTPLNGIIGTLDCLLDTELGDEQQELADIMRGSSSALLAIVNDVLDLSKIEAGAMTLEKVPFDLLVLAGEVRDMFRATARAKGIALRIDLARDLAGLRRGDPARLRQVLANLLSNAVKFTAKGHVELRIYPGPGDHIAFSVTDTGIGIPESALERIFEQFRQADDSTTRCYGGTGLGLSICKELIGLMGGAFSVDSEVGVGSKFHFEVPLPADTSIQSVEEQAQLAGDEVLPFRHVLVVDDNPINRVVAQKTLARLGIETTVAVDGDEAIHLIASRSFDLVFMDCSMPHMDGFQATRVIRSMSGACSRVPIVAMTALVTDDARRRCLDAGMNDFLAKPIQLEAIRRSLHRLAERSEPAGRALLTSSAE
ncbi:hypothetical protein ABI59_17345 [Acidobacteria bacterium Mor1]|nr:hypothetical protein ABI59_17345 [Acidobacteria bacterium Mor1]